jgi:hypothetical protein
VPVNVLYREREVGHIVADAEPRAMVTTRELARLVPAGTDVWDLEEVSSRGTSVSPVPRDPQSGSAAGRDCGSLVAWLDGAPRDDRRRYRSGASASGSTATPWR